VSEEPGQQFSSKTAGRSAHRPEYVARAAPDGYTLMVNTIPFVANSHMYAKLLASLTDSAPISLLASSPSVLVVHPVAAARSCASCSSFGALQTAGADFAPPDPAPKPHIARSCQLPGRSK